MAATRRTASEYSYSKTLYGSIRYAQSSGPARFHVVWSTWKTRCCNSSSEESKEEHKNATAIPSSSDGIFQYTRDGIAVDHQTQAHFLDLSYVRMYCGSIQERVPLELC